MPGRQICYRHTVNDFVDGAVQLFPYFQRFADVASLAVPASLVQAGHRSHGTFCQTQNHAYRAGFRGNGQQVTALGSPDALDISCPVQQGDDLLQIFLGDALPGGDIFS